MKKEQNTTDCQITLLTICTGKSESYINIKYKDELSRQEAFNKLTAHVDYLKTLNEGWLFFEKGYDILTDRTDFKNRDTAQAFVYVILLIAIACGICGADYANHEIRLLRNYPPWQETAYGNQMHTWFFRRCHSICTCIYCAAVQCAFGIMARRDLMLRRQVWSICGVFRRYIGRAVYTYHNADALYRGITGQPVCFCNV